MGCVHRVAQSVFRTLEGKIVGSCSGGVASEIWYVDFASISMKRNGS